ncbi:MAG TPA: (2Fe-2S)-binding protein [Anaeromyxobacter sp.]
MIVCLCKVVSDRAIRAAREAGARTTEAVAATTGAGTGCGCCHGTIAKILVEPCRPVPCADCPNRTGAPETVPARIAAGGLDTP